MNKRQRTEDSGINNEKKIPMDMKIPVGWCVHKFGGSSLASADCYRNVCNILLAQISKTPVKRICVVVSAMGAIKPNSQQVFRHLALLTKGRINVNSTKEPALSGSINTTKNKQKFPEKVTNLIIRCHALAAKHDDSYLTLLQSIKNKHITVVRDLFSSEDNLDALSKVELQLNQLFEDMRLVLRNTWFSRYIPDDHWSLGFGELWSARVLSSYLNIKLSKRNAKFMDGRDVIHIFPDRTVVSMDTATSLRKLQQWYAQHIPKDKNDVIVCTGYIASDSNGKPTTLGRDGSDYSASIMANLFKAETLTIWTDVDGVYSANPTVVLNARLQKSLSYDEASELAYFGAKVMHPRTMAPVINQKIPIWLRNSFNPKHTGSCIQSETSSENAAYYGVIGLSYIPNLVLVSIEGCGMIAVPGVASRYFGSLARKNINVVMISQGGAEHSICCAVPLNQSDMCVALLRREFRDELEMGTVNTVGKSEVCACLAIVGDGMKRRRGVAGRMFCALGGANVSIIAIAQGGSERNISAIVRQNDAKKGLIAVHKAFLDTPNKSIISPTSNSHKPHTQNLPTLSLKVNGKPNSNKSMQTQSELQVKYEKIKDQIRKLNDEANTIANTLRGIHAKQ